MCGPATAIGVATGVAQGASAIGNFQQGRAATRETNQARVNQYRDALAMREYTYNKELGVYNQQAADLAAGLQESEIGLKKSFTQLDKRAAERISAAAFGEQEATIEDIQREGKIASMLPGGSRDRVMALTRGIAGRRQSSISEYLLRSRFGDITEAQGFVDQATSYRRKLFSQMPLAPTKAPAPSAPVMQQGPSALSLIGGLGSAALGGLSAGLGAANDMGRPGTPNARG